MENKTVASSSSPAQLIELDNGIHKIVLSPTREAIDAQFKIVLDLIKAHPSPETEKLLLLFDVGDVSKTPNGYFVNRARKFWSENLPDDITLRVAYMAKKNFFLDVLKAFLKTLNFKSERRFFNLEEEAQAIEWLLAGRMFDTTDEA